MKLFLIKTFSLGLPVLALLLTVNFFGDAAHLFDRDYEKKVAEIILEGNNATNISNLDERLLQEEIIGHLGENPDVVVLGSSRSMLIRSEFFSDVDLRNHSVSGASIEDIIAIYQMYKGSEKLPAKIILNIDPWIFNQNNGQKRWKSIADFYYTFHHKQEKNKTYFKYKELFSLSYFQSSLKNIPNNLRGQDDPVPTQQSHNLLHTILQDGSLVYKKGFRDASESEILKKAAKDATGTIYSLGNFNKLSPDLWNEFATLIEDIEAQGVEIEFFLAPYHPLVYERIKNDYKVVLEVEDFIRTYAEQNNILLYGSYNPKIVGGKETYFYDGEHSTEEGIKLILSQSLKCSKTTK